MMPRICVVTAGHLSTCPRMLKAADALHGVGYRVHVVSANHTAWATAADRDVMTRRRWEWTIVDCARETARGRQLATGLRRHAAHAVATLAGPARAPFSAAVRAISRAHDELVEAVCATAPDFVYGGTTGAIAAAAEAADTLGVPYALDLEDFYSADQDGADGERIGAVVERVEREVLPPAAFLSTSTAMIADAYAQKYGVGPVPIHNTFSIAPTSASIPAGGPLRIYWFSQTLGAGRGLEDLIMAVGAIGFAAEIHLRARPIPEYLDALRALQRTRAPGVSMTLHEPSAPDTLTRLAQPFDLGFSGEAPSNINRRLCLGNKIFTYLAAGVPVVLSHTPAQTAFAEAIGAAALTYRSGDADGLASALNRFAADDEARRAARCAARAAAADRWHWEHCGDRGALLAAFKSAVG